MAQHLLIWSSSSSGELTTIGCTTKNSGRACPLMAFIGTYVKLNSRSSTAHFARQPRESYPGHRVFEHKVK
ncbi:hypothetical protein HPP92_026269 [Vanilla planifolia]|uniref:Uncharacterized protein n=1 Tax=Vanilla planifolia TaxID=51239 RepID=A0A835PGN7_VANPL|nr:hypothetical protein HPP92_026269 [Vanilla planifolia]